MSNSSYKIYITSSSEAAYLLSRGLREATPWSREGGKTLGISHGSVNQDCRIPAIHHGENKFFVLIEYRNGEDFDYPKYEITIC